MTGMLKIKTAPSLEPISKVQAKAHLRVDIADDDTLIEGLITASRRWIEGITGVRMISQTWYLYLDAFPGNDKIELPIGPVSALTSVKYTDGDGDESTVTATDYWADFVGQPPSPARIVLRDGQSWPSDVLKTASGVVIEFIAGYGAAGSDVPTELTLALNMMVEHWYEHRGAVTELRLEDAPFAVQSLLASFQMHQRGA